MSNLKTVFLLLLYRITKSEYINEIVLLLLLIKLLYKYFYQNYLINFI